MRIKTVYFEKQTSSVNSGFNGQSVILGVFNADTFECLSLSVVIGNYFTYLVIRDVNDNTKNLKNIGESGFNMVYKNTIGNALDYDKLFKNISETYGIPALIQDRDLTIKSTDINPVSIQIG